MSTQTIRPMSVRTLLEQRTAWQALDNIAATHPNLPPAYIVLESHARPEVVIQCASAPDMEAWREALNIPTDDVASHHLSSTRLSLECSTLVHGVLVRVYAQVLSETAVAA